LILGKTPDSETDTEELIDTEHWVEYRRTTYIKHGSQERISKWVTLEKGKKYYIEAAHLNGGGGDHFTTGVEIEQETLNPTHPRNIKEV
jgi:hypothetical protein